MILRVGSSVQVHCVRVIILYAHWQFGWGFTVQGLRFKAVKTGFHGDLTACDALSSTGSMKLSYIIPNTVRKSVNFSAL